ncbi:MAG: hypothetical protein L6W00_04890 [Lentisphaeria bacterium]|nr:MAG: hypothetical protein L6W00_04890 [Lentisphaeria bacterium]
MKSLPVTLCSALALLACGGEPVNLNSHMELGEPGRGVPGYFLDVNRAAIDTVRAAPDRLYTPRTVSGESRPVPDDPRLSGRFPLPAGTCRHSAHPRRRSGDLLRRQRSVRMKAAHCTS